MTRRQTYQRHTKNANAGDRERRADNARADEPSQIGLEFRSVGIRGDGDADFDIVRGAAECIKKFALAAIEKNLPSQLELALGFDQILDARVRVGFDHGLNPDEGTDCCRKPIGPVGNCVKNKALHIHHATWLRW